MKKKLVGISTSILVITIAITSLATANSNNNEKKIILCNIDHNHEDFYCISEEIQEYWTEEEISSYNFIMKEREEYIIHLKNKGYNKKKLFNAMQGYDSSLRLTEDVFERKVFEIKDTEMKIEEK